MDIELVFRLNGLEVRRLIPLRESPAEVLRRVKLRRSPDPLTEAAFQLVNEVETEADRALLSGMLYEVLSKIET